MSEQEIKEIFSKNLCRYLEINEKTQADLYKYMGVTSAAVSDWCNGKKLPRLDKIQSICNWLRIEKSDLLEEKTTPAVSARVNDFIKAFDSLTEEQQAQVFDYVEFLSSKTPPSP